MYIGVTHSSKSTFYKNWVQKFHWEKIRPINNKININILGIQVSLVCVAFITYAYFSIKMNSNVAGPSAVSNSFNCENASEIDSESDLNSETDDEL